jgi:catalase
VLGVHSLVWDETQKIAGKDPDFNRKDLWERIEMGDYPEYELGVQIVEEEDEKKFDFDLLDATKIIPEELVPVEIIGKMTLNRNPDNFFAETEQVAFHPGHVVPGIDFTNDPLLQGRLFSYLDTQLIRLGGPNFSEIPINRPIAEVKNNQRDGFMRQTINKGRINYEPNSLGGGCPMHSPENMGGFVSYMEKMEGHKVRERSDSFADHFTQATLFWNSQSDVEKQHIVEAFQFELGKVEHIHIRQRIVELAANIDKELAAEVAKGIGVKEFSGDLSYLEESAAPKPNDKRGEAAPGRSAALSMENTVKSPKTRKVAILAEDGFDYNALTSVKDALKAAGAQAKIVSKNLGMIKSADGQEVEVDKSYPTTASVLFDAVFVPGGRESIEKLKTQGDSIHWINETFKHCKPIAAAGDAVNFLMNTDIKGVNFANGDSEKNPVSDKGVVTIGNSSDFSAFAENFIDSIAQHRHWSRQKQQVPA